MDAWYKSVVVKCRISSFKFCMHFNCRNCIDLVMSRYSCCNNVYKSVTGMFSFLPGAQVDTINICLGTPEGQDRVGDRRKDDEEHSQQCAMVVDVSPVL